jgi:hypothetical protein
MRLIFNEDNGKDMRRAQRREAAKNKELRTRKQLAKRSKGLYTHDDEELIETVYKRNHVEQTGRLRLLKGAVSPRRQLIAQD